MHILYNPISSQKWDSARQKSPAKVLDFFAYKEYNKDKGGESDAETRNGKQKSDGILLRG